MHSHIIVWIQDYNKVRDLIFDNDTDVQTRARKELLDYFKLIAQSTFGDMSICTNHDTSPNMSNSIIQGDPNTDLKEVSKQCIREMRHFKRCKEHKGQIGVLVNGNGTRNMSGPDIVHSNTIVCMNDNMTNLGQTKEQLDILSYLYPYHMAANDNMRPSDCRNETFIYDINRSKDLFSYQLRHPLLQLRFNYHDHNHRPSCFKKGCECRFHLPRPFTMEPEIYYDENNMYDWYNIDGTKRGICRYEYMPRRNIGDQFLNVNNDVASCVLGCNTNIGLADRSCFYYVTMYSSKQNQKEEKKVFLTLCEGLHRRILRRENELIESNLSNDEIENNMNAEDYSEGFRRVLSAMFAHTSNDIISATMAHLLLHQEDRFSFSHDFMVIPTPHLLGWYDDEDLYFRLRTVSKKTEEKKQVADYFYQNMINRPSELEHLSCYELIMWYEI